MPGCGAWNCCRRRYHLQPNYRRLFVTECRVSHRCRSSGGLLACIGQHARVAPQRRRDRCVPELRGDEFARRRPMFDTQVARTNAYGASANPRIQRPQDGMREQAWRRLRKAWLRRRHRRATATLSGTPCWLPRGTRCAVRAKRAAPHLYLSVPVLSLARFGRQGCQIEPLLPWRFVLAALRWKRPLAGRRVAPDVSVARAIRRRSGSAVLRPGCNPNSPLPPVNGRAFRPRICLIS